MSKACINRRKYCKSTDCVKSLLCTQWKMIHYMSPSIKQFLPEYCRSPVLGGLFKKSPKPSPTPVAKKPNRVSDVVVCTVLHLSVYWIKPLLNQELIYTKLFQTKQWNVCYRHGLIISLTINVGSIFIDLFRD